MKLVGRGQATKRYTFSSRQSIQTSSTPSNREADELSNYESLLKMRVTMRNRLFYKNILIEVILLREDTNRPRKNVKMRRKLRRKRNIVEMNRTSNDVFILSRNRNFEFIFSHVIFEKCKTMRR